MLASQKNHDSQKEMIQTASIKRSVAATGETQKEKVLFFKVTGEATKV